MAHAENEIEIHKPVTEVFSFIADGLNNTTWRPGLVSIELFSGQAGAEGATYKQILKGPGGRTIDGDYIITKIRPNVELSFAVIAGPARPVGSYYFEPIATGTKIRFVLDSQPKGMMKLMGPMISKTMQSEVSQLAKLKQVLENS